MIKFKETDPVVLESRLGKVGSIQSFDLWDDIETIDKAKTRVADIATLSYGLDCARSPLSLYQKLVTSDPLPHISCLEFLPVPPIGYPSALPNQSMRGMFARYGDEGMWKFWDLWMMHGFKRPAFGFLVECPVFVARQWMRHRSFSYLEMSRRYVKDSKVPVKFYGEDCADSVERRIYSYVRDYINEIATDNNEPAELARRVIPVGMMTKFYVGGFNQDWNAFCELRSDSHAQKEIRVFSDYIKGVINACK